MSSLAKKLVQIMTECRYVQKSGENSFHRYRYATAADVLERVNGALVKHNVASLAVSELIDFREVPTAKGTDRLAIVRTTLTLIDADTGETMTCVGLGAGQDSGDKAVMKAQTASIKYAYLLTLAMATGDDPEADTSLDERTAQTQPSGGKFPLPGSAVGTCSSCGTVVSPGVAKVSAAKHNRVLCMKCQASLKTA